MTASLTSGSVVEVLNKEHFEKYKDNEDGSPVVVDFYAEWCAPCMVIKPTFEELAKANPDIYFLKVNVDTQEDIAALCEVNCMPTFCFFKGGKLDSSFAGANKDTLKKNVSELKEAMKSGH